jgi:tRNA dimethylallyltransferase
MNFTDAGEDPAYRKELQAICNQEGRASLHQRLGAVDPETAARLHPNDVRRVIRALEVVHLTGKTMSKYRQDFQGIETAFNPVMVGLTMDREMLYRRIDQRVDQMLAQGLIEEVEGLMAKGYHKDLVSMQGLGYKEIIPVLEGMRTMEEASEILKRDTRRYAKRQWTWFRRDQRIHWMNWKDLSSKLDGMRWIISHFGQNISFKTQENRL